jgi:hypothetical protein
VRARGGINGGGVGDVAGRGTGTAEPGGDGGGGETQHGRLKLCVTEYTVEPQTAAVNCQRREDQRTLVPGQCLTVVGRRPARSKEIAPRERSRAALAKKVGFIYLSPLRTLVALEPLVQVCQSRLQLVRRHVLWGYGWA